MHVQFQVPILVLLCVLDPPAVHLSVWKMPTCMCLATTQLSITLPSTDRERTILAFFPPSTNTSGAGPPL